MTAQDLVLEPSAGTGILARLAELAEADLVLNELSDCRLAILRKLFPGKSIYPFNAEQIHDYLPLAIVPTVVLMNPPFTASHNVHKSYPLATVKHIRSASLCLAPGGRLVVMTAQWFAPSSKWWNALFQGLDADVRLTVKIAGHLYSKHGTTIDTCLMIIDRQSSNFFTAQDEQKLLILDLPDMTDEPVMTLLNISHQSNCPGATIKKFGM